MARAPDDLDRQLMRAAAQPRADASRADLSKVRAKLDDATLSWMARSRGEAFPSDRFWVAFACGSCGEISDTVFRFPASLFTQPTLLPLYRSTEDVAALLEDAFTTRPAPIESDDWQRAAACACRAPEHHRRIVGVALFHTVCGAGAGLVCASIGEGSRQARWSRVLDGSGHAEPVEPTADGVYSSFGRPLTLFESWAELLGRLPTRADDMEPGAVIGSAVEPGVFLFVAKSDGALAGGVAAKLDSARSLLVRLDSSTVRNARWPSSLAPLAERIDSGMHVALVVERSAMLAQLRAWSRGRIAADILDVEAGRWELSSSVGGWPIAPAAIALVMVQMGRTLAEACAQAAEEAYREVTDRVVTLQKLTERVPAASFEVEGTKATARHPDGQAGRTIDLFQLPANAADLDPNELARQAAFLFDAAPPWADRSRVCSCGAPVSLERRLVEWPWSGDATSAPWVLGTWGEESAHAAAEVVALCCDLHTQMLAKAELSRLGLDEERIRVRLIAESGSARQRVQASFHGEAEDRVALVRGPFVAGVVLSDSHLSALNLAFGAPLPSGRAAAWALGSDMLAIGPAANDADELVQTALRALGHVDTHSFVLRRDVDLSTSPAGTFEIIRDRNE